MRYRGSTDREWLYKVGKVGGSILALAGLGFVFALKSGWTP